MTGILVLLLGATAYAETDYYVWVDENGVTNYSERPGDNTARQMSRNNRLGELQDDESQYRGSRPGAIPTPAEQPQPDRTATTPAVPAASTGDGGVDPDALIAEERAAIAAKIAETKRANCTIGKRNLAQLEAYARIRVKDDSGQERVLTEEERQAQISEARQIVRDNCTG
ncbi:MAG: DUF4124 domain-containing protein [Pseudomonadales bacterium]